MPGPSSEPWCAVGCSTLAILNQDQCLRTAQLVPPRGFGSQNLPSLPSKAGDGTAVCAAAALTIAMNLLPLWTVLDFWL